MICGNLVDSMAVKYELFSLKMKLKKNPKYMHAFVKLFCD